VIAYFELFNLVPGQMSCMIGSKLAKRMIALHIPAGYIASRLDV